MSMNEDFSHYRPNCNIRIIREDTGEVLYTAHNTIANTVKWLFSRLMANVNPTDPNPPYLLGHEPLYSVWGLALGAGSPTWAPETQPQETPAQTALLQEFLRKPLSRINFVQPDNSGGFTAVNTLSTYVDFQCVVNATTDNITQSIREMGLIGGGTNDLPPVLSVPQTTPMLSAPYFTGNPANYGASGGLTAIQNAQNTVTLINYKTLPPLLLPPGVNIIFSWVLSF
jgi:hypothetical protein